MSIPKKVREQLHKRAGSRCEICGRPYCNGRRVDNAHHRRNQSQGGPDVLSNLLLLCGSGTSGCHGDVTLHPAWAVKNGYTVHGTETPPGKVRARLRGRWVLLGDDGSVTPLPRVGAWGETPAWGEGLDDEWPLGEYPEVMF